MFIIAREGSGGSQRFPIIIKSSTYYEIVIPDIGFGSLFRITHDISTAITPVVNYVIYKLIQTFHFRITGFIVDIQVTV